MTFLHCRNIEFRNDDLLDYGAFMILKSFKVGSRKTYFEISFFQQILNIYMKDLSASLEEVYLVDFRLHIVPLGRWSPFRYAF